MNIYESYRARNDPNILEHGHKYIDKYKSKKGNWVYIYKRSNVNEAKNRFENAAYEKGKSAELANQNRQLQNEEQKNVDAAAKMLAENRAKSDEYSTYAKKYNRVADEHARKEYEASYDAYLKKMAYEQIRDDKNATEDEKIAAFNEYATVLNRKTAHEAYKDYGRNVSNAYTEQSARYVNLANAAKASYGVSKRKTSSYKQRADSAGKSAAGQAANQRKAKADYEEAQRKYNNSLNGKIVNSTSAAAKKVSDITSDTLTKGKKILSKILGK